MPEWVRIVFIDVLVPIVTALIGYFSHDKIEKKINKKNTKIVAKGKSSQAAGRDRNVKN